MESLRGATSSVRQPEAVSGVLCSYAELTAFFAGHVHRGVITRTLLKRLLYRQCASDVPLLCVRVRRSHRVECVLFPTKLSFSAVERVRTSMEESSPRSFSTLYRQDAVDRYSSDGSCASNPFGYIQYFAPEEQEESSLKKPTFLEMSDLKSEGSSFDVPQQPETQRACEDLSALGHSQDVLWTDRYPSVRKTLPCSIPLSDFKGNERSASLQPRLCVEPSGRQVTVVSVRTGSRESAQSETSRTFFSHLVHAVPCEVDYADATSPRSSDSGLADVARTVSECDCTAFSSCCTPRTSAQPAVPAETVPSMQLSFTSTHLHNHSITEPSTAASFSSQRSGGSCTVVSTVHSSTSNGTSPPGIYRSGMYAHWWAKARIPPALIVSVAGKLTSTNLFGFRRARVCVECPILFSVSTVSGVTQCGVDCMLCLECF